jgi:hypothetical protein
MCCLDNNNNCRGLSTLSHRLNHDPNPLLDHRHHHDPNPLLDHHRHPDPNPLLDHRHCPERRHRHRPERRHRHRPERRHRHRLRYICAPEFPSRLLMRGLIFSKSQMQILIATELI